VETISSALAEYLAGEVTTLATCWKITRRDGVVLGFTDQAPGRQHRAAAAAKSDASCPRSHSPRHRHKNRNRLPRLEEILEIHRYAPRQTSTRTGHRRAQSRIRQIIVSHRSVIHTLARPRATRIRWPL
jgi:hypothetical protein